MTDAPRVHGFLVRQSELALAGLDAVVQLGGEARVLSVELVVLVVFGNG